MTIGNIDIENANVSDKIVSIVDSSVMQITVLVNEGVPLAQQKLQKQRPLRMPIHKLMQT